jgi:hypothetical protein
MVTEAMMSNEFLRDGKPAGTLAIKGLTEENAELIKFAMEATIRFFEDTVEEVRLPPTIELDDTGYSVRYRCWLKEPARKPMTEEELRVLFRSTNTAEPLCEGWPGLERFARAIEKHHGIGTEK